MITTEKMNRQHILIFFFAMALFTGAQAQTLNAYAKGAQEAFEKKDYYSAYNFLRIAHEIEPNNTVHTYNLAEAARHYAAFTMAEKYYSEVDSSANANDYPATSYWLGYVRERLGKYQEALDLYQIYLTEHGGEDAELTASAQKHADICTWALREISNKDTTLTLEHLGPEVNTTFSEFGAAQTENLLYYSSLRFLGKNDVALPEKPYAKILISENDSTGVLDTLINDLNFHTSHTAFNAAKDRVFYTICDYINGIDIRCDIYYRDIIEGEYGLAQKLPEPINMAGFTSTQPHVGYDPQSDREVLYFVSDRPGGKGRLDIWFCYIAGQDNFTAPENLASVNSVDNDLSPFYHRKSKTLYLSSNGYLGFGGLDVYSVKNTLGVWDTLVNMGSPINSSLDDAFYSLSEDGMEGYFSSNRLGSMYLSPEDEACCFDIYHFEKPPLKDRIILVRTFETYKGLNPQPLMGVKVTLAEQFPNVPADIREDYLSNLYFYKLLRDRDVNVTGTKKGYKPGFRTFNTSDNPEADTLIIDLFLEVDKIDVFLYSKIYFDNDEPGPSTAERTEATYLQTYEAYNARRGKFAEEYGAGHAPDVRDQAVKAIDGFFNDSIPKGKRELETLMHILEQYLRDGKQMAIYLKGYASPLASAEYNLKLGKRRISSIQNEFKTFRGGVLWKYMESGDLVVAEKSFGEEMAPKTVSDDPRKVRQSIYSPEASEERRVEIVEVKY
jgi:outer membrane protein OmpA-like peptidoglycan-associated protein